MSLLIRAALLGGIAYLITRSLSEPSQRRYALSRRRTTPRGDLHPGENNLWPTSESQERAGATAGPTS